MKTFQYPIYITECELENNNREQLIEALKQKCDAVKCSAESIVDDCIGQMKGKK